MSTTSGTCGLSWVTWPGSWGDRQSRGGRGAGAGGGAILRACARGAGRRRPGSIGPLAQAVSGGARRAGASAGWPGGRRARWGGRVPDGPADAEIDGRARLGGPSERPGRLDSRQSGCGRAGWVERGSRVGRAQPDARSSRMERAFRWSGHSGGAGQPDARSSRMERAFGWSGAAGRAEQPEGAGSWVEGLGRRAGLGPGRVSRAGAAVNGGVFDTHGRAVPDRLCAQ